MISICGGIVVGKFQHFEIILQLSHCQREAWSALHRVIVIINIRRSLLQYFPVSSVLARAMPCQTDTQCWPELDQTKNTMIWTVNVNV